MAAPITIDSLKKNVRCVLELHGLTEKLSESILEDILPHIRAYAGQRADVLHEEPQYLANNPRNVYDYSVRNLYADKSDIREKAYLLLIDNRHGIKDTYELSVGGFESTVIDKRVVVKTLLDKCCKCAVLVHNHPSGNPRPSHADIRQTKELRDAFATLDLQLLDHVIVGEDSFFSFSEDSLFTCN